MSRFDESDEMYVTREDRQMRAARDKTREPMPATEKTVLRPWEQVDDTWYQRVDADGFVIATVRLETSAQRRGKDEIRYWIASVFRRGDFHDVETWSGSGFDTAHGGTAEQAKGQCDEHLRLRHILLWT